MISYEIAMGLAIIAIVITYGSLDLQEMVRMQGGVWFGWLPRWGIFVQPLAFILLLTAGIAESKRIPFDLPEGESELILGYMLEYSGGKQAAFMLTDLAEQALIAMLLVTFFFGGWQVPWLYRDGFHLPGGAIIALAPILVSIAGIVAFLIKVRDPVPVHGPDPMDAAAVSLRSVDETRLEDPGAAWAGKYPDNRVCRGRDRRRALTCR